MPSSSLPVANVHIPSPKTSIPVLSSTSETTLDQNISFPLPTSHITMPIPTSTITQTSSLVSTMDGTTSFTESVVEFDEYIVVPLGDYFYKKSSKVVLIMGKNRSKDQGGGEANQIIWTQ